MTAAPEALQVLRPTGYRLLVRLIKPDEKMQNGLYRPGSSQVLEDTASQLGEVVAMGDAAYQDAEKFPGGAWCAVGDTIMMRAYSGTRLKVDGAEFRLINDDTVEAVVSQPHRVERVV